MRFLLLFAFLLPAHAWAGDDLATALKNPEALSRRAHVARMGVFALDPAAPIDDASHRRDGASYQAVPVLEATEDRVRIVHDADDARILMYVQAADLGWAIERETRLKGRGDVGVWLLRGAPVTVRGSGARRRVTATFGELTVSGPLSSAVLTKVFATPDEPPPGRATMQVPTLLDAPGGRALVGTPDGLVVEAIAPGSGDWILAEHRTRYLRVRGWTRKRDILDSWGTHGTGMGGGYGMSHTPRVDVRDRTCFHASPGGEVIGIQLGDSVRYAPDIKPRWYGLYVGNAWGLFEVYARVESTDAAGKPVFARCPA